MQVPISPKLEFPPLFKLEEFSNYRATGKYEGMLMTVLYNLDPQQAIIPILLAYLEYYNVVPHELFAVVYVIDGDEEIKPWMKVLEVTGICSIIAREQLKKFSPITWQNQN